MDISSLIWNVCDDELMGVFKPHEYSSVILPFVVLRRLDCVLEQCKDKVYNLHEQYKDSLADPAPVIKKEIKLPFYNTSRYDLSGLKSDPQNVKSNFDDYLNGYSESVCEIIENFDLKKHIEKLNKHARLYQLIAKFTEVDLHPDKISNHEMGTIYEELLRRFSEMSNEESGDHYTPRDIVQLLVSLVFAGDRESLQGASKIISVYDCCCGTGGMLTVGKKWVLENINSDLKIYLYGQELNDTTYSICQSDFLISGEEPENIKGPKSVLSADQFAERKFDYMIVNPPFGVSWKSEKAFIENEKGDPHGRFFVGTPRISDGALLFLQHLIHKMEPGGSRIGIVVNGSPLFTGGPGSGESEIRKWIIENDWLECIVSLPDQLFFNTGISTYLWIVSNHKKTARKGKVQLIDGSAFFKTMKKSLGDKRKYIAADQQAELLRIYERFEEGAFSKVFNNQFFGYTKVTIEQAQQDEAGNTVTDRQGNPKPDPKKRDYERIPLDHDINAYYKREVNPHLPHSWIDRNKDKVGYEINFTKYFYQYKPLRSLAEITQDLIKLDAEIGGTMKEILD